MQKKRLSIGISIGANDMDIASWYNMLVSCHLSIHLWTSYLVMAYLSDTEIDIGTASMGRSTTLPVSSGILFGSGNAQKQKKKRGWTVKGEQGEYICGSIVMVTVYDPVVIMTLQDLKEKGFGYAGIIKMLIRKYLKLGTENIPPADISGFLLRYEAPPDMLQRIESEPQTQPTKIENKTKPEQKLPEPIHTQKNTEQKKRNPLLDLIE